MEPPRQHLDAFAIAGPSVRTTNNDALRNLQKRGRRRRLHRRGMGMTDVDPMQRIAIGTYMHPGTAGVAPVQGSMCGVGQNITNGRA